MHDSARTLVRITHGAAVPIRPAAPRPGDTEEDSDDVSATVVPSDASDCTPSGDDGAAGDGY